MTSRPASSTEKRPAERVRGIVVSHSHWDRAWYLPFERFRLRLVRLVDRILDLLDRDPAFQAFMLDGQTVLLEDYLEIRPERAADIKRLVQADRLQIGPWYVLPDLFLVSGEAIIRNLQRGAALCAEFGKRLPVGYVPDPFGHTAQMPQIMRGFGLDTYILSRGLSAVHKQNLGAVFDWVAPDGSSVLAIYQRDGYFNAGNLGHPHVYGRFDGNMPTVEQATKQIRETLDRLLPLQQERTILLANGFDHMPEQPELPRLLASLEEALRDVDLKHGTLVDFVEALQDEGCDHASYTGDLIGNEDHPILLSVYSARMYLKQQNHAAQQALVQYAEPLRAWLHLAREGPDARPVLDYAWRELLRNHPHDDICGCSIDAVHRDNEQRFAQVQQVAHEVLVEGLEVLQGLGWADPVASGPHHTDVIVWNPHPFPWRYRVEATIAFPNPEGEFGPSIPAFSLEGCNGTGEPVIIEVLETEAQVVRSAYLEATWSRRYRVCFEVDVPALGYQVVHIWTRQSTVLEPKQMSGMALLLGDQRLETTADGLRFVDETTGFRADPLIQFEYQVDSGDTYSFGPVPAVEPIWAAFVGARRASADALVATYELDVPAGLGAEESVRIELEATVELLPKGGVHIRVAYENKARNGRLRLVLPTGTTTLDSFADSQFRLVANTKPPFRTPESDPERYAAYPGELTYPTHHQGDGVIVDGETHTVWVANRGLPEYELLTHTPKAEGTHIAVTLHRAVGQLSVVGGRIRRCGAGPPVPTPEAQCLRPMFAEVAFGVMVPSVQEASTPQHIKAFAHPAWTRELPYLPHLEPKSQLPREQSLLQIDNPAIILSAFRPEPDGPGIVLRLYNISDEQQTARVSFGFPVRHYAMVTLDDEWNESAARDIPSNHLSLSVHPHRIVTLIVR